MIFVGFIMGALFGWTVAFFIKLERLYEYLKKHQI